MSQTRGPADTERGFLVAALYHFVALDDFESLKVPLVNLCEAESVVGTIILAAEGINGTICGPDAGVRKVLAHLREDPRLSSLTHKESRTQVPAFKRIKVRLKREIVTMGIPHIDPTSAVGTYVSPQDWNSLISNPDVLLIDTRNDYEVEIGTFKGAVDPITKTFREFPQWVENNRALLESKEKVAMFCTGGIRCEKATAYLKDQGFDAVYHLQGGILKYLEEVPAANSLWQGECFVFDSRVSVVHGLKQGEHALCYGCRRPLSESAKSHRLFEPGVSCPRCFNETTHTQKASFRERHRQVERERIRALADQSKGCKSAREEK